MKSAESQKKNGSRSRRNQLPQNNSLDGKKQEGAHVTMDPESSTLQLPKQVIKQRSLEPAGESLEWYPESGEDIDPTTAGKALKLDSSDLSISNGSKTTAQRRAEAEKEQQEAEDLFKEYEQQCLE